MMRRGLFVVALAVAVLAQMSLLPALRPFGVVPNLALVMVVLVGLEGTASLALAVAVAGGFALDLASGANLGLWTGVLVLAALVGGLVHRAGIEVEGPLVPGIMVAAGTILMTVVVLGGLVSTVTHWSVGLLVRRCLIELVLNLILMMMVRPLVRWAVPRGQ
jgi:hypothetical protein